MLTDQALDIIGDMLPIHDPETDKGTENAEGGFGGNNLGMQEQKKPVGEVCSRNMDKLMVEVPLYP